MDLSIKTINDDNEKNWIVDVTGEIDIFNSQDFKTAILDLFEKEKKSVKINCKELTYIDSTGLGALIAVLKKAKEFDGEIILENIRPNLEKLFKITNLDKVFIIEGDKDE